MQLSPLTKDADGSSGAITVGLEWRYFVMILIFHETRSRLNSLTMSSECAEQCWIPIRKTDGDVTLSLIKYLSILR